MKKTAKGNKETKPEIILVSDLAMIEELHRRTFTTSVLMFGKIFKFEGRRLLPKETDTIRRMMELALPPQIPGENPGDGPRYDFQNKEYKDKSHQAKLEARAYALWLGYPCFKATAQAGGSGMPASPQEITDWIQGRNIDEDALQLLFKALTETTTEVAAYVSFTSGNGSLKS